MAEQTAAETVGMKVDGWAASLAALKAGQKAGRWAGQWVGQ